MTSQWLLPFIFGLALMTAPTEIEGMKHRNILQTILEAMHSSQDIPTGDSDSGRSAVQKLPTGDVFTVPLSNLIKVQALRSFPDVSVDHSDNAVGIFRKRYLPIEYNTDFSLDGYNGFQQYIMKKMKREPEQFPNEMYSVQGGKQQLEVDLDKEFTEEEKEFTDKANKVIREERPLAANEQELNENGLNARSEEGGIRRSNYPLRRDIGDIAISGADLPSIEYKKRSGEKKPKNSNRRKKEMRKRWWAASSLYKLRIPKSNLNRSHRTRTALPRFDPVLYFIGLGK